MSNETRLDEIAEAQDALYQQIMEALVSLRDLGDMDEMSDEELDELESETDALLEMVTTPELEHLLDAWRTLMREHDSLIAAQR
jgi:hypothetical protein